MHPESVHVLVEIPFRGNVKYEINEDHQVVVDRVLSTSMVYPGNYGHIPSTLAGDGDPMDALIINHDAFMPGSLVECRVVAVLFTEDEKGRDEKIIMVPVTRVDSRFDSFKDMEDVPEGQREKIWHFFEHYKCLEKGKHVKVVRWGNREEAWHAIQDSKQV
jgi:inorganic pyrophosphatase